LLVFGASGAVGQQLRLLLAAADGDFLLVSRRPPEDGPAWLRTSLEAMGDCPAGVSAMASLGPLDAFADWLARIPWPADLRRVVALGSTSVITKRESAAAGERELAARLAAAEARLEALARAHGIAITVLRATLIYGGSGDTIARIGHFARRWRVYPHLLGAAAKALRQPVHVADLARACASALARDEGGFQAYNLPGGETLALNALIARAARLACPSALPLPLPTALLLAAARCAGRLPTASALTVDSAARMGSDHVFDGTRAWHALGHRPREFTPTESELRPPS
jgi:nucleoside-diphosphate-sugar epimerase